MFNNLKCVWLHKVSFISLWCVCDCLGTCTCKSTHYHPAPTMIIQEQVFIILEEETVFWFKYCNLNCLEGARERHGEQAQGCLKKKKKRGGTLFI